MPSLGPAEVLVILVLALLIFGPQKMPEIGRQVGRAMREFRKAQNAVRTELRDALDITGGAVTGTNVPPPSYGTPAPTAPPEPASADAPSDATAPPAAGEATAAATPAPPAAPTAPVAEAAGRDDDDPATGRGLGAASRPVAASRASTPGADDDDPAFGRRAGTPVEPR
jgi:TatA/E family protein of Tat protein translocase